MKTKILRVLVVLPVLAIFAAGCSITTTGTPGNATSDASIYLSTDSGATWRIMTNVPSLDARPQNITDVNVNLMSVDPEDSMAVYLATFDQGLYYTYNITNGWNHVTSLPSATINDVKVDPKNKCIIYAATANKLYRSSDCSRTWTEAYYDNNANVAVTSIVIDHYNSRNVYISTSRGDIIKSISSGTAWRTIQRLDEGINQLIISPLDSRKIFVATTKNNIYSFFSNTDTNANNSDDLEQNFLVSDWTDLNAVLRDYDLGSNFKDIIINPKDGVMYLATAKLILRSPDNGITWENIKLLPPEKDAVINALAINPQDSSDLYYVTNTAFFHSKDGGATWQTKNLPTKRAGRELILDFNHPNNVYLGTVKLK
ncbi:hypothetical protein GW920_02950 [Candidatus Falkowbacteria bacterium]|uniref:Sortilin N-terminal domain-containing protein n=1 Tax=Candidatus Falkowbacteria bacterium CG10_big_fil_rev_8_21_14_0_10_37_18 TaxID=1974562 RepID=A0A2H0V8R0_9BACT|nr:hypothetical protein [Candidatus Falkowbacteria bacterium]NCQ12609.1 hypothetical protein [Candidatus Falkowbacteria bacterium]OIO05564.1 MAG: hypothetical protein AUJ26_02675 [Candidatus Falkowbacteria bacterium CG1_02_37_21]PIR95497.1 MAG: hypothetical protein COT93_02180 [Candidatus Falkowbacteria bacterium CG10_big_fil_rev_8_21_14_0_10_37_18]PJC29631.1 MAG: hypothetical protein CO052_02325 [Candidatus Saccharibacteria bacterium CG_4_9_14_0_2_um_filter_41_9]